MQSRDGIYQINQLLPDIPTGRYPQSDALSREIFTAHIPQHGTCAAIPNLQHAPISRGQVPIWK